MAGSDGDGIDRDWAPVIPERIAWVELDGEVVALDTDARQVHRISATGALLWQCLDGEASLDELVDDVCAAFGITRNAAESDIDRFVSQMLAAGLLERSE